MDGGRIIIDAKLFYEHNSDSIPRLQSLASPLKRSTEQQNNYKDARNDVLRLMGYNIPGPRRFENETSMSRTGLQKLSELDCRLCTPVVRGFNLHSHEWGECSHIFFHIDTR